MTAVANIINHFNQWYKNVLYASNDVTIHIISSRLKKKTWGNDDTVEKEQQFILSQVKLYLQLLWVKTYNYNMWERTDDECDYKVPNDFAEEDLLNCLKHRARCNGINIESILRAGLMAEGIGRMTVEKGCDPLFIPK